MERPTSEKVALLERVLNRIRENARDTSSRSHFSRGATEPRKGVPAARPSVPPPTVAFPADHLPDATPLAAAAAVSPPPPAVVAAPSPPPPVVIAAAPSPRPPAVAAAPSPPPPAVAAAPSPRPPAVAAAPPSPPPVLAADAPIVLDVPGLSPIDDAPTPESVDALPASGQTRLVSTEDLDVLRSAHEATPPGGPRATQAYGQPEAPQVDVAFDERQAEARAPSPPPAPPSSPAPSAPDLGNDVTGVRPIAPAAAGAARVAPGSFGGPPFEVDLASTIELPASELASAVHSSTDEEAPAPASSPRLRSSLSDDDTYPAVSPSSLPPARGSSAVAAEARSEAASDLPDAAVEPAADSQVGMRAPSAAPAGTSDEPTTPPPAPVASEMAPPPLRRSDLPRPQTPSYHPEAEPAAAASADAGAPRMVVAPPPPAVPAPEARPAPAPLATFALEADSFARKTVQGSAANFVSAVRGPAPRTFGELLDASLSLGDDL